MSHDFKYDIAISFAEEDRNIAVALECAFELKGIKSFYYPECSSETTGHDLRMKLPQLYKEEARYAVVILSERYMRKPFCKLELQAIQDRINGQNSPYLVLIKSDDKVAKDVDLPEHFAHIKWDYNPKEISSTVWKMLNKQVKDPVTERRTRAAKVIHTDLYNDLSQSVFKGTTFNFHT